MSDDTVIEPGTEQDAAEEREEQAEESTLSAEERAALNPDTPPPRGNRDLPDIKHWGGIRPVKKALRRSATIMANREAIAYELLCMASAKITDFVKWDDEGRVHVIPSKRIDPRHARMIRRITSRTTTTGSGDAKTVTQTVDIELFDKVQTLRILAHASGMLAKETEDDKPAIVGMRVIGPKKRKPKTYELIAGKPRKSVEQIQAAVRAMQAEKDAA